jgi:hypothetical protein
MRELFESSFAGVEVRVWMCGCEAGVDVAVRVWMWRCGVWRIGCGGAVQPGVGGVEQQAHTHARKRSHARARSHQGCIIRHTIHTTYAIRHTIISRGIFTHRIHTGS